MRFMFFFVLLRVEGRASHMHIHTVERVCGVDRVNSLNMVVNKQAYLYPQSKIGDKKKLSF